MCHDAVCEPTRYTGTRQHSGSYSSQWPLPGTGPLGPPGARAPRGRDSIRCGGPRTHLPRSQGSPGRASCPHDEQVAQILCQRMDGLRSVRSLEISETGARHTPVLATSKPSTWPPLRGEAEDSLSRCLRTSDYDSRGSARPNSHEVVPSPPPSSDSRAGTRTFRCGRTCSAGIRSRGLALARRLFL